MFCLNLMVLLGVVAFAKSVQAWEGHDWNQWKAVTTWRKPDLHTVYDLYQNENAVAWKVYDGPHRFPPAGRQAAYRWLEAKGAPSSVSPPATNARNTDPRTLVSTTLVSTNPPALKTSSAFFPRELVDRARANAREHRWAAEARDSLVAAAKPWMEKSDDDLWNLMFGHTIRRSWHVWSDGYCPACRKPVPMYEWVADAMQQPWKMRCPQCQELFPKNDFLKFYRSGLDESGVFDPQRADRSLLFNAEHPDASDPLHRFGVDDGEGYAEGNHRWRFIGAYLIFGQWKQAVVNGIRNLAAAYVATGDPVYAHKAGLLLDRVADLYPSFDFGKEGVLYEGPARSGYISTWHDACVEVHDLAVAYDAVFEGLATDGKLAQYLEAQATKHQLANPKRSLADLQRNIESRLFRDTLANRPKIESNYPSTDVTMVTLETVLGWPANRAAVIAKLDDIIKRATAVDGVSGEKGLAGYSLIAPSTIASLLGRYARSDPDFLAEMRRRHPRLHALYRFHLDTLCLGQYYPRIGDTGSFAEKCAGYAGLAFSRNSGINPSAYAFLWDLYAATGDTDFVRLLFGANGASTNGLPYDLLAADPVGFQAKVAKVIGDNGAEIRLPSVNKTEWGLAILRSGEGANARAAWLDYDSGERHGHADAMNLGLFAKGLDLLPDFGYPPVQYGGWSSPRAVWYTQTAAHNTVAVDNKNTRPGTGTTTLWFDGRQVRVMRAAGPLLADSQQYERTVALVDLSERDSYLIDLFRVEGGREHTRFLHSQFGRVTTQGLSLTPVQDARFGEVMRNFIKDPRPAAGWSLDWAIEDRLKYRSPSSDVHLRYTDLTRDAEVSVAEGWVSVGSFGGTAEAWIPRLLVERRSSQPPLASTFVGVLEPYEDQANLAGIRRLELLDAEAKPCPDSQVGIEIRLADGRRDIFISANTGQLPISSASPITAPLVVEKEFGLRFEGDLCWVRFDAAQRLNRVVFCRGKSLRVRDLVIHAKTETASFEIDLNSSQKPVVAGPPEGIDRLEAAGVKIWPK